MFSKNVLNKCIPVFQNGLKKNVYLHRRGLGSSRVNNSVLAAPARLKSLKE